ncbi:predicted protein [Postia placenta Mad-698-R]|nr:predicted protein [Postia placenta Mad-698-R]
MHDGILIGIALLSEGSAFGLARHLPPLTRGRYHCPRPIILDSQLRLSPDCKLLKNYRAGTGRRPWVVCTGYEKKTEAQEKEFNQTKQALRQAGARIVDETGSKGLISLPMLMMSLSSMGIRSVMVEGGARVIQSFLAEAESSDIVDTVVVTVAPTLVGESGVGYGQSLVRNKLPKLQHISTEVFGSDAVIALKVVESTELSGLDTDNITIVLADEINLVHFVVNADRPRQNRFQVSDAGCVLIDFLKDIQQRGHKTLGNLPILSGSPFGAWRMDLQCGSPSDAFEFLRAYNADLTDHFYTIDHNEMERYVPNGGYASQGDAGWIFPTKVGATVPLYRLYVGGSETDHFYTTNQTEKEIAISSLGYTSQGIAGYVYSTQICGSIPLYRLYQPSWVDHFYTISWAEDQNVTYTKGYVEEGIQCYVLPDIVVTSTTSSGSASSSSSTPTPLVTEVETSTPASTTSSLYSASPTAGSTISHESGGHLAHIVAPIHSSWRFFAFGVSEADVGDVLRKGPTKVIVPSAAVENLSNMLAAPRRYRGPIERALAYNMHCHSHFSVTFLLMGSAFYVWYLNNTNGHIVPRDSRRRLYYDGGRLINTTKRGEGQASYAMSPSTATSEMSQEPECSDPSLALKFLRAYNPSIMDHFYTIDPFEMDRFVPGLGYESQGDAGWIFPTQTGVTIPLYRMHSQTDHFYTTDEAEMKLATAHGTYVLQGIAGIPLYRLYKPVDHFHTISWAEDQNMSYIEDYVEEGIQCYVLPDIMATSTSSSSSTSGPRPTSLVTGPETSAPAIATSSLYLAIPSANSANSNKLGGQTAHITPVTAVVSTMLFLATMIPCFRRQRDEYVHFARLGNHKGSSC